MFVIYFLAVIFLICAWVTSTLYIVAWYDAVNLRCNADEGQWRQDIRWFSILNAVIVESFCLFLMNITMPIRFYLDRLPKNSLPDSRPPILFVHGWGAGSHSFLFIYLFLKYYGFKNMYFMTYRPIFSGVEILAEKVADKIDWVLQETGAQKLVVISHSMGGVLTRYALKHKGSNGKIKKLIALAGPHMGSRVAAFMPVGQNTLQLTYKSAFMEKLASGGLTPGDTDYVSIYSDFDNFVIPPSSSLLGGRAKNLDVPFHGHIRFLYSYRVIRLIIKEFQ